MRASLHWHTSILSGRLPITFRMVQATVASNDPWMGYGSLIAALIGLHVAALIFWLVMVVFNERKNRKQSHQD